MFRCSFGTERTSKSLQLRFVVAVPSVSPWTLQTQFPPKPLQLHVIQWLWRHYTGDLRMIVILLERGQLISKVAVHTHGLHLYWVTLVHPYTVLIQNELVVYQDVALTMVGEVCM